MFSGEIVAVDGPSGAGKTTLAAALAAAFSAAGRSALVLPLDSLCGGWDDLAGGVWRAKTVAAAYRSGMPLWLARYDWLEAKWDHPRIVARPEVLILDGCGAASDVIGPAWRVWCAASAQLRAARVRQRDDYDWSAQWENWHLQHEALTYHGRRGFCAAALACQWRYFSAASASVSAGSYAAKISTTITSVSVPVASSGGMTSNTLEPTR